MHKRNIFTKLFAIIFTSMMIFSAFPGGLSAENNSIEVRIESYVRGNPTDVRSSELLVAKVDGYDGDPSQLTYKWVNNLGRDHMKGHGTYLYVYNSPNLYEIEGSDGEIEIHNTDRLMEASEEMEGRSYNKEFTGQGYAYAAIDGYEVSDNDTLSASSPTQVQRLTGTIEVEVYDEDGNLLGSAKRDGTYKRESKWFFISNYIDVLTGGIFAPNLYADLADTTFAGAIFQNQTIFNAQDYIKQILSRAGVLLTRDDAKVILDTVNYSHVVVEKDALKGYAYKYGTTEIYFDLDKGKDKFHNGLKAEDITLPMYVIKEPTFEVTDRTITITKDTVDSRATYYIDGKAAKKLDDGSLLFEDLEPNEGHQVEARIMYGDFPASAYQWVTTGEIESAYITTSLDHDYLDLETILNEEANLYVKEQSSTDNYIAFNHLYEGKYVASEELAEANYDIYYGNDTTKTQIENVQLEVDANHLGETHIDYYTVQYNTKGGTFTNDPGIQVYQKGEEVFLTDQTPQRAGYEFASYAYEDGFGDVYKLDPFAQLTDAIDHPYVVDVEWKYNVQYVVNIEHSHNGGYDQTTEKADAEFIIVDKNGQKIYEFNNSNSNSNDYTTQETKENDTVIKTTYTSNDTVSRTLSPNVEALVSQKANYRASTKVEVDDDYNLVVTIDFKFDPSIFNLNFSVEMKDTLKADYPDAVYVDILFKNSNDEFEQITQQTESMRIEIDKETGLGNGVYPVWRLDTNNIAYIYSLKIDSVEIGDRIVSPFELNTSGDYMQDEFIIDIACENSTAGGAYFENGAQVGSLKANVQVPRYNVSFDAIDGDFGNNSSFLVVEDVVKFPIFDDYIPSKTGYAFMGWLDENNNVVKEDTYINDLYQKDVTLKANWVENTNITHYNYSVEHIYMNGDSKDTSLSWSTDFETTVKVGATSMPIEKNSLQLDLKDLYRLDKVILNGSEISYDALLALENLPIVDTSAKFQSTIQFFYKRDITVSIESLNRGPQEDLRASEMLVAKVEGYDGDPSELTYKWRNELRGVYLYAYTEPNTEAVEHTTGEIQIINRNNTTASDDNNFDSDRRYNTIGGGEGFAYAAIYGKDTTDDTCFSQGSTSDVSKLRGTLKVEVYDPEGNLIASDTHIGTTDRESHFVLITYYTETPHGIVSPNLKGDLDAAVFAGAVFKGEEIEDANQYIKSALAEAHIVARSEKSSVSIQSSKDKNIATIDKDNDKIKGVSEGLVNILFDYDKDGDIFHDNSRDDVKFPLYVIKKPTIEIEATKITLSNFDPDCTYYLDQEKGEVSGGTIVFDNLHVDMPYLLTATRTHTEDGRSIEVSATMGLQTAKDELSYVYLHLDDDLVSASTIITGDSAGIAALVDGNYVPFEEDPNEKGVYSANLNVPSQGSASYGVYFTWKNGTEDKYLNTNESIEVKAGAQNRAHINYYRVIYDLDGGSFDIQDAPNLIQIYREGNEVKIHSHIPKKDGYIFEGYEYNDELYVPADNKDVIVTNSIQDTVVLKAIWSKKLDTFINVTINHKDQEGNIDTSDTKDEVTAKIYKSSVEDELLETINFAVDNLPDYYTSSQTNETINNEDVVVQTVYTATAKRPENLYVEGIEYIAKAHKLNYVTLVEKEMKDDGLHIDITLNYESNSAMLDFEVEMADGTNTEDYLDIVYVDVLYYDNQNPELGWQLIPHGEDDETYAVKIDPTTGRGHGSIAVVKDENYGYRLAIEGFEKNPTYCLAEQVDENTYVNANIKAIAKVENGKDYGSQQAAYFENGQQVGTLSAVITTAYDLSFDAKGGQLKDSQDNFVEILKLEEQKEIPNLENYIPEKDGYTFGGWYLDENFKERPQSWDAIIDDTTLYAKWIDNAEVKTISYLVQHNVEGIVVDVDTIEVTHTVSTNDPYVIPIDFASLKINNHYEGYKFESVSVNDIETDYEKLLNFEVLDDKTVVEFYYVADYTKVKDAKYTVRYVAETVDSNNTPIEIELETYEYIQEVWRNADTVEILEGSIGHKTIVGYSYKEAYIIEDGQKGNFDYVEFNEIDIDSVITFVYTPNPAQDENGNDLYYYYVEHRLGDYVKDTLTHTAELNNDQVVVLKDNLQPKDYDYYNFSHYEVNGVETDLSSEPILVDKDSIITLVYDRPNYKYRVEYYSDSDPDADASEAFHIDEFEAPLGSKIKSYIDRTPENQILGYVDNHEFDITDKEDQNVMRVFYGTDADGNGTVDIYQKTIILEIKNAKLKDQSIYSLRPSEAIEITVEFYLEDEGRGSSKGKVTDVQDYLETYYTDNFERISEDYEEVGVWKTEVPNELTGNDVENPLLRFVFEFEKVEEEEKPETPEEPQEPTEPEDSDDKEEEADQDVVKPTAKPDYIVPNTAVK